MIQNCHRKILCHLLIQRVIVFSTICEYLNRLIQKTYSDATTETFTYDSKGNILTATNQNISYTFTYDASGKPLTVSDSYGKVIKYEYDTAGNKVKRPKQEEKKKKYIKDITQR